MSDKKMNKILAVIAIALTLILIVSSATLGMNAATYDKVAQIIYPDQTPEPTPIPPIPEPIIPRSIQAAIDTRSLIVRNTSSLYGAVEMQDALSVIGPATFSDVTTTGDVTVTGAIIGSGDASYASVSTTSNITDAGALSVSGVSNLDGGIAVDTTNFTVNGTTGAVHSAAGLDALSAEFGGGFGSSGCSGSSAGAWQCNGALTIGGAATITGAVTSPGGFVGALTGNVAGNVTGATAAITDVTGINAAFTTVTATLVGNASGTNATYTTITGTLATITQTNISRVGILDSLHTIGEILANSLTVTSTATIADLSVTNPATITLATAEQPNVTSLGTLSALTVGGTGVTATLNTANQPNVTNLGTQAYLTATNFTFANAMPSGSGSAANVNYCMSGDCDTGLYYPGDNNIGIATGGTVRAQLSNTGLDVTPTLSIGAVSFTGAMKWGTASGYTSGDSISHGYATTPTMCILQPARDVTSTLTITETGFSSDMATVAEPIYWMCGQ